MKRVIIFSLIASIFITLFTSCSTTKITTIKGEYIVNNKTETSTPYDKVWANIIDFFATNHIPISLLDKDSGLIIANEIVIGGELVSPEDLEGNLRYPNAWFVIPYGSIDVIGGKVTCSFNVRISSMDNGNTSISINVADPSCVPIKEFSYNDISLSEQTGTIVCRYKVQCKSTGRFEKELLDLFK